MKTFYVSIDRHYLFAVKAASEADAIKAGLQRAIDTIHADEKYIQFAEDEQGELVKVDPR